ncbi:(2E,6E)-farnesyl diphosphate synthase [Paraglaciecola sp. 20A4]|uniref:(2E,6E)-farnesyl diphosphate synthase n=1 Tax=Paraglaciecola sp. 20A4 TaxID=2687288 RepID=UPI0014087900|nr:(2E,6E)-farnesyl diphosphate synthase [Paraglaciecola sp. 20A4]
MTFETQQKRVHQHVDALLQAQISALGDHAPTLKNAIQYALLMGGKRMRPFLVYAVGEALGIQEADLDAPALALECIHAYSLVHDDLPAMDDDDLRRGHPTCHIQFDEANAILAGDALQTLAFEIISHYPLSVFANQQRIELVKILSRASGYSGMCGGQAIDLDSTNKRISQSQLELLHSKKTGALILAAVEMACTLSTDITDQSKELFRQYAQTIGLAFQVQDDILDVIGDSETLGKPQGSDQEQNKSTYPALLGIEGAQRYLSELHQEALQALLALPYNTQVLRSFTDFVIHRNY